MIVGLPGESVESLERIPTIVSKKDFPLDSVSLYPLEVDRYRQRTDIEQNPMHYGITFSDDGEFHNGIMSRSEMVTLAAQLNDEICKSRMFNKQFSQLSYHKFFNVVFRTPEFTVRLAKSRDTEENRDLKIFIKRRYTGVVDDLIVAYFDKLKEGITFE
jgi:hypothetical protein